MSRETSTWLNQNVLIGYTDNRGHAWHYRESSQGDEPNHYPLAIPVADVERRLFNWDAVSRKVAVELPATFDDMTHTDDDGNPLRWAVQDDRQAIASDDDHTVMGFFKSGYQAHQYREWLIGNVADILDDDLNISSAGLLRNRAVAWVEISMPETLSTPEGFDFRPNLLATTSFDGTVATTYKRTVTATVCDNTYDMAMSEKGQMFKAKHSKYSGMKMTAARDALGIVHTMAEDFAAEIAAMCAVEITDKQWSQVLDLLVPIPEEEKGKGYTMATRKRESLSGLYKSDARCAPWSGTALGVMQAFNTYDQHLRGTNKDTIRAERNMQEAINGSVGKLHTEVAKALTLVTV